MIERSNGDINGQISLAEYGSYRLNSNMPIAKPVETTQPWLPESNPPPFPDCSVVSHSNMVIAMPTSMTFEIGGGESSKENAMYGDYYDYEDSDGNESFPSSACDDQFFLGQVGCCANSIFTEHVLLGSIDNYYVLAMHY